MQNFKKIVLLFPEKILDIRFEGNTVAAPPEISLVVVSLYELIRQTIILTNQHEEIVAKLRH